MLQHIGADIATLLMGCSNTNPNFNPNPRFPDALVPLCYWDSWLLGVQYIEATVLSGLLFCSIAGRPERGCLVCSTLRRLCYRDCCSAVLPVEMSVVAWCAVH